MRDIRDLIELVPETNESNFGLVEYEDLKGELRPEYIMDRQGYSMLVTGFTGKKAKQFTYKYTKAFEDMAKEIEKLNSNPQVQLPTDYKEALVALLKKIEENEVLQIENISLKDQIGFLIESLNEVDARKAVNVMVQQYGKTIRESFGGAWNLLYRRVYATTNINLTSRKNHRNTKSKLDCIDTVDEWQKVVNVAKNMYLEDVGTLEDLQILLGRELNIKLKEEVA